MNWQFYFCFITSSYPNYRWQIDIFYNNIFISTFVYWFETWRLESYVNVRRGKTSPLIFQNRLKSWFRRGPRAENGGIFMVTLLQIWSTNYNKILVCFNVFNGDLFISVCRWTEGIVEEIEESVGWRWVRWVSGAVGEAIAGRKMR